MKKIFVLILALCVIISSLAAAEGSTAVKAGPAWMWSDVDITLGGMTSHGSSSNGTLSIWLDNDLFLGEKETFGLRIGGELVAFPFAVSINGEALDTSGASPVYFRQYSLGFSRKFTVSENSLVTVSPTVILSFEDEDVEGVLSMTAFSIGLMGDVEYAYIPGGGFAFKLGIKLGGPLTSHYTMKSDVAGLPDMDEWINPSGFYTMPYVGLGFYI